MHHKNFRKQAEEAKRRFNPVRGIGNAKESGIYRKAMYVCLAGAALLSSWLPFSVLYEHWQTKKLEKKAEEREQEQSLKLNYVYDI